MTEQEKKDRVENIVGHHITISWAPGEPMGELHLDGDRHPYTEAISALLAAAFEMRYRMEKDCIEEGKLEQIITMEKLLEQIEILKKCKVVGE